MSFTSSVVRGIFGGSDDKRDAGLTTPEDVVRFDDIFYGPDPDWHLLDVYRPGAAEGGALPVIVSVHGGGWVYGDKDRYQFYCMSLAQRGFAVVNFSYRLAPKHKFPAPIEDTARVFAWVRENAAAYHFDLDRVFAVGDSAGAHTLGLYCCLCTNPAYAELMDIRPTGPCPRAVALNCGVYRIGGGTPSLAGRLMREYLPKKAPEDLRRRFSVPENASADFPPSFLMTCEGDFLADAAPPMAERLRELGVPVEYRYYGDPEHPLGHVFHLDIRLEEAARCGDEECAFFRSQTE